MATRAERNNAKRWRLRHAARATPKGRYQAMRSMERSMKRFSPVSLPVGFKAHAVLDFGFALGIDKADLLPLTGKFSGIASQSDLFRQKYE